MKWSKPEFHREIVPGTDFSVETEGMDVEKYVSKTEPSLVKFVEAPWNREKFGVKESWHTNRKSFSRIRDGIRRA